MTDLYLKLKEYVKPQLKRHEGERRFPYKDTVGKITIGVGRNLTDRGLMPEEVDYLLCNDIKLAIADAKAAAGVAVFDGLSLKRQAVLVDMAFNLGLSRLLGFKNTLLAVGEQRYDDAARLMLESKWAKQVGGRALALAQMMKDG